MLLRLVEVDDEVELVDNEVELLVLDVLIELDVELVE